jgi:hypothetical protein
MHANAVLAQSMYIHAAHDNEETNHAVHEMCM